MSELRVVVIDDNYWARSAMARELDRHPRIAVVHAIDQDEALLWSEEAWAEVDVAIVDIFDEQAPNEVGTDVFSGIAALEQLRGLPVRTLAVTPHCQHPLVQLRIHQAQADWLYHRWEVNDLDLLIHALLNPDSAHRPTEPSNTDLREHGAVNARPNDSVRVYQRSSLHGLLRPDVGLKQFQLSRRTIDRFRSQVARTGFTGTPALRVRDLRAVPRWPDVRDFVLTVIGRRGVPATEVDRDDAGPSHTER